MFSPLINEATLDQEQEIKKKKEHMSELLWLPKSEQQRDML